MENIIEVKNLTKDYGQNRGIFDITFSVKKGEVFGFVGTNGSGKTTIIRHLMGFLKAQKGQVNVLGLDAWKDSCEIKKSVEYIPGEIAFPDLNNGITFLKNQADLLKLENMNYADYLIQKLQLDPSANLKRMSKGMKQKTAIVAALMADKDVIILDEPTTGLDPLMRETFLEIILEEKKKGKTIIMSSQMFDELETTCDRVALILDGHIIDIASIDDIKNSKKIFYKIEFKNEKDFKDFKKLKYKIIRTQEKYFQYTISISKDKVSKLFNDLKNFKLKFISEVKQNLEKHFKEVLLKVYENENKSNQKSSKKEVKKNDK